jgi:hypothetical protein
MSTDQLQIFAAEAVENLSQTFNHYAAAAQEEFPVLTDTLKSYTAEAIHQSQTLIKSEKLNRWALVGTLFVTYLGLVQVLRFRNLRKLNKKYAAYLKDPYKLDYKVAHGIMNQVMLREAPWMYGFSTQMALIKTYAVAPGTGLLVATRQLTQESTVGKRAEDTGVILSEFIVGELDSERGMKALAKMNWLHRRYGNKIRQPEMLHTLAMFGDYSPSTCLSLAKQNSAGACALVRDVRMALHDSPRKGRNIHLLERNRFPDGDVQPPRHARRPRDLDRRIRQREHILHSQQQSMR